MNQYVKSSALAALAEQEDPATLDLWPAIEARLEQPVGYANRIRRGQQSRREAECHHRRRVHAPQPDRRGSRRRITRPMAWGDDLAVAAVHRLAPPRRRRTDAASLQHRARVARCRPPEHQGPAGKRGAERVEQRPSAARRGCRYPCGVRFFGRLAVIE